jgi:hypothetical protein
MIEKPRTGIENNESIEKLKPEGIIAGNPGIGKTEFTKDFSEQLSVFDLDSNPYRKDKNSAWPENYLQSIEEASSKYDLVLISSDPEIVKELSARGHEVTVVCANEGLEDEYRERYILRENTPEMVDRFIKAAFASNEEQARRFEGSEVVFLQSGQYLSDIVDIPE